MRAAVLLLLAVAVDAGRHRLAAEAFPVICAEARKPDGPEFGKRFDAGALGDVAEEDRTARRRALAALLDRAKIVGVRQEGEHAVARFRAGGEEEREVLLRYRKDGGWRFVRDTTYVVAGPTLDARRGRKPASHRLTMRTWNGPYRASAFSFVHATGDTKKSKNRMDLWFCHNRDFHASNGEIVSLGKTSLDEVAGIPASAKWDSTAPVEKGHVYVLRCRRKDHADFYVKFLVKKAKGARVTIAWTLLSEGLGAPDDITKVRPDKSRAPDWPWDGLCGKNS